jgi:hypothetical protein
MRWLQTEYILKGIYLGLLLDIAVRQAEQPEAAPYAPLLLAACAFGGLLLALTLAGLWKIRQGYRIRGRLAPFILFLLLESPGLVYTGILGGTFLGVLLRAGEIDPQLVRMVGGGAALGVLFGVVRSVRVRRFRLGLSLLMGAALLGGLAWWLGLLEIKGVAPPREVKDPSVLGTFLLLGLPVFYLLTFAGRQEESEVEVGAMCATLGLGLVLVVPADNQQLRGLAYAVPVVLYFL